MEKPSFALNEEQKLNFSGRWILDEKTEKGGEELGGSTTRRLTLYRVRLPIYQGSFELQKEGKSQKAAFSFNSCNTPDGSKMKKSKPVKILPKFSPDEDKISC